ncbi:MAG: hypothetical protein SNJ70_05460 [Armatimonadota bacterium]
MNNQDRCILCNELCTVLNVPKREITEYFCKICGHFFVTRHAELNDISKLNNNEKIRIACCTREKNIQEDTEFLLCSDTNSLNSLRNELPFYSIETVTNILENVFPHRIQNRFDRALGNLCKMSKFFGDKLTLNSYDFTVLFLESPDSIFYMIDEMDNLGYLKNINKLIDGGVTFSLSAKGIQRMQELESDKGRKESNQCFVAMWFNPNLDNAYENGIKLAIEECGFKSLRINEEITNDKICDRIIANIKKSRFVVADFTGHRGGVYFEAGFALGLGIPVIWTCREDCIEDLHFDTRQYNHIVWENEEDLKVQLINRIRATID